MRSNVGELVRYPLNVRSFFEVLLLSFSFLLDNSLINDSRYGAATGGEDAGQTALELEGKQVIHQLLICVVSLTLLDVDRHKTTQLAPNLIRTGSSPPFLSAPRIYLVHYTPRHKYLFLGQLRCGHLKLYTNSGKILPSRESNVDHFLETLSTESLVGVRAREN